MPPGQPKITKTKRAECGGIYRKDETQSFAIASDILNFQLEIFSSWKNLKFQFNQTKIVPCITDNRRQQKPRESSAGELMPKTKRKILP